MAFDKFTPAEFTRVATRVIKPYVTTVFAVFCFSAAGSLFVMLGDVPPIAKTAWRIMMTALLISPMFCYKLCTQDGREEFQ
mmetsp:Transcript_43352/g.49861  ORF Transcript_43352/g.49861 Transcript_43352/m.49861 type:complete len:81 (+) Transcript_43352:111-353(+)